jgi:hypothetical protein
MKYEKGSMSPTRAHKISIIKSNNTEMAEMLKNLKIYI